MIGALDIGGTHVSAARVDVASGSLDPAARCRVELPADATRSELLERIGRAARAVGEGVERVGVAVPGPFDYENGISRIRHKLEPLYGVDLRALLADALALADSRSVLFLNDADAFLLGEWSAGAARGHARAVGVTLGTGLGSAFIADGKIVADGPTVPPEGSLHLLDFRGAPVEDTISRRALLALYGADAGIDVEQLAARARAGDARARETFRDTAAALAEFVSPWLRSFDASCLVVGGSIARAWDLLAPVLEAELDGVTRAAKLDEAPLLGAALYAARHA